METGVALVILGLSIAVVYWAPLRRLKSALGVAHLVATGHAFLVLGVVAGLALANAHQRLTVELTPIVGFVAGWIGFAAGMRFNRRVLGRLPRRAWLVALLPAISAAVVVSGAGVGILMAAGVPAVKAIAGALVLGGAAASSGPTLIGALRNRRAGRDPRVRSRLAAMELSAGLDDLVTVIFAVVAFSLLRPETTGFSHVVFALVSVGGGLFLGFVTWLFLGGRASSEERLLLGLGMLMFIAGSAGWLHLSPASVAAIAAMTLVNLPGDRGRQLFDTVRRVERPAAVILMVVIGFDVVGPLSWVTPLLLALMTIVRLLAKHGAGQAVATSTPLTRGVTADHGWALGLAPQGALGLMVALSFFGVWHDDVARNVLAAIAGAALLNELAGPWLLSRAVRPGGDRPKRASAADGGAA